MPTMKQLIRKSNTTKGNISNLLETVGVKNKYKENELKSTGTEVTLVSLLVWQSAQWRKSEEMTDRQWGYRKLRWEGEESVEGWKKVELAKASFGNIQYC